MRCCRKILRISYKDHVTKGEGPCHDPAGNRTTRRPDHRKETQTAVVWLCLPFIRSGQNHLARHSERGKKTRQTEEEVGRQHQGMDRHGVRQVPQEQRKMEETGCEIICGTQTTFALKELMMMRWTWSAVKRSSDWILSQAISRMRFLTSLPYLMS